MGWDHLGEVTAPRYRAKGTGWDSTSNWTSPDMTDIHCNTQSLTTETGRILRTESNLLLRWDSFNLHDHLPPERHIDAFNAVACRCMMKLCWNKQKKPRQALLVAFGLGPRMSKYWMRRQEGLLEDVSSIRKDWLLRKNSNKIKWMMQIKQIKNSHDSDDPLISCRRRRKSSCDYSTLVFFKVANNFKRRHGT